MACGSCGKKQRAVKDKRSRRKGQTATDVIKSYNKTISPKVRKKILGHVQAPTDEEITLLAAANTSKEKFERLEARTGIKKKPIITKDNIHKISEEEYQSYKENILSKSTNTEDLKKLVTDLWLQSKDIDDPKERVKFVDMLEDKLNRIKVEKETKNAKKTT